LRAPRVGSSAMFLGGAALFAGTAILVRRRESAELEEPVFRAANESSDSLRTPVRAVMQAGTFVTVPVSAVVALLARRPRLAASLAAGGTAAWLLAKAAKPLGGRARPSGILKDVRLREKIAGDLGWPSGHAAVATSLALIAGPQVSGSLRPLIASAVGVTAFGRMYVGAHLPLDLAGGAGLGMMIAAVAREVAG
jgi:membrane-associated phospholipid phosphatase